MLFCLIKLGFGAVFGLWIGQILTESQGWGGCGQLAPRTTFFVTIKVESDGNYGLQIGLQSIFLKNSRVLDRFRLLVRPNIDRIQKLRCLRIRGTKTEFFSKGEPKRLKNMASRSFQTFLQESLHTVCSKNGNFQKTNRSTSHNRNPSMLLRHVPTIHKKISRGLQQGVTHIDPP